MKNTIQLLDTTLRDGGLGLEDAFIIFSKSASGFFVFYPVLMLADGASIAMFKTSSGYFPSGLSDCEPKLTPFLTLLIV